MTDARDGRRTNQYDATDTDDRTTHCAGCEKLIHIVKDEWWQHSWEEQPSEENVGKAIEEMQFRDWFRENHILCPDCHKHIVQDLRRDNND